MSDARITDTVPMKLTLTATYLAPVWSDDSGDLDVIAREEAVELQKHVDGFVASFLGESKDVSFTVEPVFEPTAR